MKAIPTAEEFLSMLDEKQGTMWTEDNEEICKAFIEFAKLHVEAALKAASNKAELNLFTKKDYKGAKWVILKDGDTYNPMERSIMSKIDKKSILNSYPLENIK